MTHDEVREQAIAILDSIEHPRRDKSDPFQIHSNEHVAADGDTLIESFTERWQAELYMAFLSAPGIYMTEPAKDPGVVVLHNVMPVDDEASAVGPFVNMDAATRWVDQQRGDAGDDHDPVFILPMGRPDA